MGFTSESAAIMQAKGVIVRKQNDELRKAAAEQAAKQALITIPITAEDTYISTWLGFTREDISKVRTKMNENLDDPAAVDRYASAILKLSVIEQKLAGRPSPGSLKPVQSKPRTRPAQIEPLSISEPDHQSGSSST